MIRAPRRQVEVRPGQRGIVAGHRRRDRDGLELELERGHGDRVAVHGAGDPLAAIGLEVDPLHLPAGVGLALRGCAVIAPVLPFAVTNS